MTSQKPQQQHDSSPPDKPTLVEATIGVFETSQDLHQAQQQLHQQGVETKLVSVDLEESETDDKNIDTPNVVYDHTDKLKSKDVVDGIVKGAAIGAASGLLLVAVPGIGVAGPIAGALGGGFVGGVAGVDEADRAVELPTREEYRRMIRDGKSLLIVAGDRTARAKYGVMLKEHGAVDVHQHPPVDSVVHTPERPVDQKEAKSE